MKIERVRRLCASIFYIYSPLGHTHCLRRIVTISVRWMLLCTEVIIAEDSPYVTMQHIIIIMYIYHALINALSAHMIHINLNMIFYTHVEHSPTKTIYIKYYKKIKK